jgi:cellobiose transport system permease protein
MEATESTAVSTTEVRPRSRFNFRKDYYGYLFIAPFIIGWLLFGLYPVYNTFYLSFTDTTMMSRESNWIGLQNYVRLFADDTFMTAVKNTWLLWILNFIPQIGIAMIASVWFASTRLKLRAVGLWRMIYYLPNLLMPAAIAALFFSLFSFYGPVNQFLVRSGIQSEVDVVWSNDHHPDGGHDIHFGVVI